MALLYTIFTLWLFCFSVFCRGVRLSSICLSPSDLFCLTWYSPVLSTCIQLSLDAFNFIVFKRFTCFHILHSSPKCINIYISKYIFQLLCQSSVTIHEGDLYVLGIVLIAALSRYVYIFLNICFCILGIDVKKLNYWVIWML